MEDIRFTPADTVEMTYKGGCTGPYHTTSRACLSGSTSFWPPGSTRTQRPNPWKSCGRGTRRSLRHPRRRLQPGRLHPLGRQLGRPRLDMDLRRNAPRRDGATPTATHPKNIEAFEWVRVAESLRQPSPVARRMVRLRRRNGRHGGGFDHNGRPPH